MHDQEYPPASGNASFATPLSPPPPLSPMDCRAFRLSGSSISLGWRFWFCYQIGTVKEGPAEYFSSRMTNKERKKTLVDELLVADDAFRYPKKLILCVCVLSDLGSTNFFFSFVLWGRRGIQQ